MATERATINESVSPFDVDTITVSSGDSIGRTNQPTAKSGEYHTGNDYGIDTNKSFNLNGKQVRFDPTKHTFYKCMHCEMERITEITNKYCMPNERPYTNPPNSGVCASHQSDEFGNGHEWIYITGVLPVK